MKAEKKSARILAQARKRRDEELASQGDEERVQLVVFTLLDDYYACPGTEIREILHPTKIASVPGTPDIILGIINVKGDIESVLSAHKLLGLQDQQPTPRSRIMIAESHGVRSGILVDSVTDVAEFPASSIHPPISTLDSSIKDLVTGEMSYEQRTVTLLSVAKILGKLVA